METRLADQSDNRLKPAGLFGQVSTNACREARRTRCKPRKKQKIKDHDRLELESSADLCFVLVLLLGFLGRGEPCHTAFLLLVDDEASPGLLLVPLEASEVGFLQLVIGLLQSVLDGSALTGSYLFLELLVDSVHGILDGDAFEIAGGHLQAQREVQIDLLDGRLDEVQLEVVLVVYARWRGIEFPGL